GYGPFRARLISLRYTRKKPQGDLLGFQPSAFIMTASLCVVADENIPGLEAWGQFCADFGISLELHQLAGRAISARDLEHCDVLLVRSVTHVNEALLAGSPVRFVGTATAGLEHVDTDHLQQRGIAFASAPGANANPVAEYVLASL